MDINKTRAKVFAHLISMPVQLKSLLIEKLEWLLHIVLYVSIYYKKKNFFKLFDLNK